MQADQLPPAGTQVSVPVVSALTVAMPGTVVAAPVAATSGPPAAPGVMAVVVEVKEWFHSSTIWVSLTMIVGTVGESFFEKDLIPTLQQAMAGTPIPWRNLGLRLAISGAFAFIALRRKNDNSVIGKPMVPKADA